MFNIIQIGNDINTRKIRQFIADKNTDIDKLPRINTRGTQVTNEEALNEPVSSGSKCFVIESSENYILGNDNTWHLIKTGGGSGVDGKNCTIQSITETDNGNVVTFEWTNNDGTIDTATMTVENGIDGKDGATGVAAGFGTPTATIDSNVGTPSVTVTSSGSNIAKVFNFAFKNLKGEPGVNGSSGKDGTNGISPIVSTTQTDTGATISITDVNGEKTITLINGKNGADGSPGVAGKNGTDGRSITAIEFVKDATGVITGGTATLSDNSTLPITITIAST